MGVRQTLSLEFVLCLSLVAGRVMISPREKNVYLDVSQLSKLSVNFSCYIIDIDSDMVAEGPEWVLPRAPGLNATISNQSNFETDLRIYPNRAGEIIIECTFTDTNGKPHSDRGLLNVTVLPHFTCLSNPSVESQVLYLGNSGHISISSYLGDPKVSVLCKKKGQEYRVTMRGTEVIIPIDTVKRRHAGTYNCTFVLTYPLDTPLNPIYRLITVRVEDARRPENVTYLSTAEGENETFTCRFNGDNYEWRAILSESNGTTRQTMLSNGSLNGRVVIANDKQELQIKSLVDTDFKTQFECVVRTCSGEKSHKVILLYREHLEICIADEDNKKRITKVLKDMLRGFNCSDDRANDACLLHMTDISFTREEIGGNEVYRVQATVLSKSQVVKFLNATLGHNGQYVTNGLKILTCSQIIHEPVVDPVDPVVPVMIGVLMIVVIVAVSLVTVLLCKVSCRSNKIDVEATTSPLDQHSSCTMDMTHQMNENAPPHSLHASEHTG